MRRFPLYFRSFFGLTALAAITVQLVIHARGGFSVVNFFSYFTNLSNMLAAGALMLGARLALSVREAPCDGTTLRFVSATNMVVVGVVYALLLRDVDLGALRPWINAVLHMVMPGAVLLDWLLWPPRHALGVRHLAPCLVFPALYLAYVLVRGQAVGWYPYPFLDPDRIGGASGVALYATGIAVAFLVAGGALLAAGNRLAGWRARRGMTQEPA